MRLLMTLILALIWAALVYGLHHAIGYDNATGYPSAREGLLWAGIAALPLLLGAFVINGREGVAKYLRWLCVVALMAEAAFVLLLTWLKMLGLVPMLGILLLLWPEIGGSKSALQTAPASLPPEKLAHRSRYRWLSVIAVTGLAALLVWGGWYRNPLPSDAEMIEHFNAHRAEFDQLVRGYRNFRWNGIPYERSSDEVKALVQRLRVYHVVEAQPASGLWYPNPYSEKTARLIGEFLGHGTPMRVRTQAEMIEYWQSNMPELFQGMAPVTYPVQINQMTAAIHVFLGNAKQPDTKFTLRYAGINKDYYHFPQVPQIRDGQILVPDYDSNDKPITRPGQRVLDSLDDYPPDWKRGECVLKRMDEQWFIAMCRQG